MSKCQYKAIKVEKSVAKVNQGLCKGCGTCAVECPAIAISMSNFTNEKISTSIKEASKTWRSDEPHILAFACNWCHNGNINQLKAYPNAHLVPVMHGEVDQLPILQAFWAGVDGILIISCHKTDCHYVFAASVAEKRVEETKKWLKAVGIEPGCG